LIRMRIQKKEKQLLKKFLKNPTAKFIIGLIFIFALSFGFRFIPSSPQANSQGDTNVPEMKRILGSNQEDRLNATRELTQRVGVLQAQEILQNSALPHTGEGHLAVHQIGFEAYKQYGLKSILYCKDYFLYACFHGTIIEAASEQGFEAIGKMTDYCRDQDARYFQCLHAAGHAINAMWDYKLDEALKTCDQLYEKDTQLQDGLSSCHNGAFMENLFGVHDFGTGKETKRDWLSSDPYFPCNAFGEKYQRGCWLNQAARIYQISGGDIKKTAQLCDQVGNSQYTDWCYDNLDRQIHPLTEGSTNKVLSLCGILPQDRQPTCVHVNAVSYYSVGDPAMALKVCAVMQGEARLGCFDVITNYISGDGSDISKKQQLCSQLQNEDANRCFSKLPKV